MTQTKKSLASIRNEVLGLRASCEEILRRLDDAMKMTDEDEDMEKYEETRRNGIIERLLKNINCKSINLNLVAEWAQIDDKNIVLAHVKARGGKRTSTFWAVDVLKYLCDLWGMDYPDRYKNACIKLGIDPKSGNMMLKIA